jgi:signal transduction histidine kinase
MVAEPGVKAIVKISLRMNRVLHDNTNLRRIMDLTAETLVLFSPDGVCLDIDSHTDLWFLQEDYLLGKNIIELLPNHTYQKAIIDFQTVLSEKVTINRKYRIPLQKGLFYAECKLIPYDGNILCRYTDITNRENIKMKLEQTNSEMHEVQRISRIGKWKINVQTQELSVNGYLYEENESNIKSYLLNKCPDFFIPEDREKILQWLQRQTKQLSQENISYRVRIHNQINYMNAVCIIRHQVPDGNIILEGIVQNVTEIHQRRNDINTLTHIVFNVDESIYGAYEDGTMKFANQIFRNNHHLKIDEDISQYKIYNLNVHYVKDAKLWNKRIEAMKDKVSTKFNINHPFKDNPNLLALEGKFYKVTEDDGSCSYWSFAHDISDRLRYETEMKRFNQLMDSILANFPASIIVKDVDDDFRFLYCNLEAIKKYKYNKNIKNYIGKSIFDIYPIERARREQEEDIRLLHSNIPYHTIYQEIDKNGNPVYFDKRKLIISNPEFHTMILDIEWDITEQELLKQEYLEARDKAEESDRLKTIFLANVSHEVRTPLNAIVGFSNLISNCKNEDEHKEYAHIINESSNRLLKLIDETLYLSKIESGDFHPVIQQFDIVNLLSSVYDTCIGFTPQGVKLICDQPSAKIIMHSDIKAINRILSILIINCYKFTSKGYVRYGVKNYKDTLEFYVIDTGKGISPDEKDKIFGLFTKYNYGNGGAGLELTICHALVKVMGGTIIAESEIGKGSKFTFTLPKDKNKN